MVIAGVEEGMMYFIKKCLGTRSKALLIKIIWPFRNRFTLFNFKKRVSQKVSLNYWCDEDNLGDAISPVIVEYMKAQNGIKDSILQRGSDPKHLYAIGSIICAGIQDCTIWGSGILNTRVTERLKGRKLDVRAVRGPLTRITLKDFGIDCPEIYGDPALLFPLFYQPNSRAKKYKLSIVCHLNLWKKVPVEKIIEEIGESKELPEFKPESIHAIDICTADYVKFINEIVSSELVVSSSLHGIILAEAYGVPAILMDPNGSIFKYYDYYLSTNRMEFPILKSFAELKTVKAPEIPDFSSIQQELLKSFPVDLWK